MNVITPRNLQIGATGEAVRRWREREPDASAFYNSLSALFPRGERFFMDSVRRFKTVVSGQLSRDIAAFVAQEAVHTREHLAFNAQVTEAGYDITALESRAGVQIDEMRSRSPLAQLAFTAALEHFTAVLARVLIEDPRHLQNAPAESARLWRWHAAEEIEHKAVAFDTLVAATPEWSGLRRWAFRSLLFFEAVAKLLKVVWLNLADLRRQDGPGAFDAFRMLGFLLFRPGLFAAMAPHLAKYLKPGFHPWQDDDHALVAEALQSI